MTTTTTKKFEEWNTAFSPAQLRAQRDKWLAGFADADVGETSKWTHGYNQPTFRDAQHAVYEADGHEEWQCFRVSLKGLTTQEKIYMLHRRYNALVAHGERGVNVADLEDTRIHNYIGALRRGGQLNANLEVVK